MGNINIASQKVVSRRIISKPTLFTEIENNDLEFQILKENIMNDKIMFTQPHPPLTPPITPPPETVISESNKSSPKSILSLLRRRSRNNSNSNSNSAYNSPSKNNNRSNASSPHSVSKVICEVDNCPVHAVKPFPPTPYPSRIFSHIHIPVSDDNELVEEFKSVLKELEEEEDNIEKCKQSKIECEVKNYIDMKNKIIEEQLILKNKIQQKIDDGINLLTEQLYQELGEIDIKTHDYIKNLKNKLKINIRNIENQNDVN
jgi:hypothetical protein